MSPHPILPGPVQRPHPPLYLACSHRETIAKAAHLGVGALVFGFGGPGEIAEFREIYDKAIAERDPSQCVSDVTTDHLAALVPAIVLDDAKEARKIGVRGQRFFSEAIDHWYQGTPPPVADTEHDDNEAALAARLDGLRERLEAMKVQFTPTHGAVYRPSPAYGDAEIAAKAVAETIVVCRTAVLIARIDAVRGIGALGIEFPVALVDNVDLDGAIARVKPVRELVAVQVRVVGLGVVNLVEAVGGRGSARAQRQCSAGQACVECERGRAHCGRQSAGTGANSHLGSPKDTCAFR